MKERIEEKLGCSIEEYFKKRLELFDKYEGLEIEIPNPLVGLEWEELDFIDNYIRHMDIASWWARVIKPIGKIPKALEISEAFSWGKSMKNFQIIYKILKILEKYMGDENFDYSLISADAMKISYNQWEQLLIMMFEEGYIKGIVIGKAITDKFYHIAEPIKPEITIKGMEYLESNSFMTKAKEMLKVAGDFIP